MGIRSAVDIFQAVSELMASAMARLPCPQQCPSNSRSCSRSLQFVATAVSKSQPQIQKILKWLNSTLNLIKKINLSILPSF